MKIILNQVTKHYLIGEEIVVALGGHFDQDKNWGIRCDHGSIRFRKIGDDELAKTRNKQIGFVF